MTLPFCVSAIALTHLIAQHEQQRHQLVPEPHLLAAALLRNAYVLRLAHEQAGLQFMQR